MARLPLGMPLHKQSIHATTRPLARQHKLNLNHFRLNNFTPWLRTPANVIHRRACVSALRCAKNPPLRALFGEEPERGDRKSAEYRVNSGRAVKALVEELPRFFSDGLLTTSIYAEDIVYHEPHYNRFTLHGKFGYKKVCSIIRAAFIGAYTDLTLDILSYQVLDRSDEIKVRWRITGKPRHPLPPTYVFDGVSAYRLNAHGLICEHTISHVHPVPPKVVGDSLLEWLLIMQRPTPSPAFGIHMETTTILASTLP